MAKGRVEAQKEITQLNLLYRVATDAKRPYEERRNAVQKLQEIYPAYFGNLSTEQIMVGGALDKYNDLRAAILATAERALRRMPSRKPEAAHPASTDGRRLRSLPQSAHRRRRRKKKYKAADKQFRNVPSRPVAGSKRRPN